MKTLKQTSMLRNVLYLLILVGIGSSCATNTSPRRCAKHPDECYFGYRPFYLNTVDSELFIKYGKREASKHYKWLWDAGLCDSRIRVAKEYSDLECDVFVPSDVNGEPIRGRHIIHDALLQQEQFLQGLDEISDLKVKDLEITTNFKNFSWSTNFSSVDYPLVLKSEYLKGDRSVYSDPRTAAKQSPGYSSVDDEFPATFKCDALVPGACSQVGAFNCVTAIPSPFSPEEEKFPHTVSSNVIEVLGPGSPDIPYEFSVGQDEITDPKELADARYLMVKVDLGINGAYERNTSLELRWLDSPQGDLFETQRYDFQTDNQELLTGDPENFNDPHVRYCDDEKHVVVVKFKIPDPGDYELQFNDIGGSFTAPINIDVQQGSNRKYDIRFLDLSNSNTSGFIGSGNNVLISEITDMKNTNVYYDVRDALSNRYNNVVPTTDYRFPEFIPKSTNLFFDGAPQISGKINALQPNSSFFSSNGTLKLSWLNYKTAVDAGRENKTAFLDELSRVLDELSALYLASGGDILAFESTEIGFYNLTGDKVDLEVEYEIDLNGTYAVGPRNTDNYTILGAESSVIGIFRVSLLEETNISNTRELNAATGALFVHCLGHSIASPVMESGAADNATSHEAYCNGHNKDHCVFRLHQDASAADFGYIKTYGAFWCEYHQQAIMNYIMRYTSKL